MSYLISYRFLFVAALLLAYPCLAQVQRYSVAVLPFTVTDPNNRTPEALGTTLPNYFEAPIFNSQKFILIDSSITAKLMADIGSSEEGLTSEVIKEIGRTYGIDILISGTITVEGQSSQPYVINARLIDTEVGEVRSVSLVRVTSDAEFQSAAQQIITQALSRFPLEGKIYAISNADVYIDIGSIHGLLPQDKTGSIYRQAPIKDKIIREQIGTFTIATIYEDSSKIITDMVIGYEAKEGDTITIGPVTTSTAGGLASSAAPSTAPDTAASTSENPATTGTLTAESNVPAEVFLEGTSLGQTPLSRELTAGDYTLELRSENYETLERDITIVASETLAVTETLEPLPATVTLTLTPPGTVVRVDGMLQLNRTFSLGAGDYTLELRHDGYETKTLPLSLASGETTIITESLSTSGSDTTEIATEVSATTEPAVATENALTETDTGTASTPLTDTTTETANTENAAPSSMATLDLTVFPPDAAVMINGQPSQAGTQALAPGSYTLEVSRDSYEPFSTQLELMAGQTTPFDVTLGASQTETADTTITDTATTDTATTDTLVDETTSSAATDVAESTTRRSTNPESFVNLTAKNCDDAATLKSGDFTTETQVLFMNQSQDAIKTYWVNYGGGLEFYNTLLPGQEVMQQTAPSHVWIITDVNNQCLAIFEPVAEPARAIVK
jgi:hypothetical protein